MAHNIGGNRELLIDNALIDTARTTAQEVLHHPVRRECVMTNSAPWEADGWVYYTLIQEQGFIRMYYLCMPMYNREHTRHDPPFHHICYACTGISPSLVFAKLTAVHAITSLC